MKPFKQSTITIDDCREILNQNGRKYTDDEIEKILSFLKALAEIDYRHFQESQINKQKENDVSGNLHYKQ